MKFTKLILLSLTTVALVGCEVPMIGVTHSAQMEKPLKQTTFDIPQTRWTYKVKEVCYYGTVYLIYGHGHGHVVSFSAKHIADTNAKPGELSQPLVEKC